MLWWWNRRPALDQLSNANVQQNLSVLLFQKLLDLTTFFLAWLLGQVYVKQNCDCVFVPSFRNFSSERKLPFLIGKIQTSRKFSLYTWTFLKSSNFNLFSIAQWLPSNMYFCTKAGVYGALMIYESIILEIKCIMSFLWIMFFTCGFFANLDGGNPVLGSSAASSNPNQADTLCTVDLLC